MLTVKYPLGVAHKLALFNYLNSSWLAKFTWIQVDLHNLIAFKLTCRQNQWVSQVIIKRI